MVFFIFLSFVFCAILESRSQGSSLFLQRDGSFSTSKTNALSIQIYNVDSNEDNLVVIADNFGRVLSLEEMHFSFLDTKDLKSDIYRKDTNESYFVSDSLLDKVGFKAVIAVNRDVISLKIQKDEKCLIIDQNDNLSYGECGEHSQFRLLLENSVIDDSRKGDRNNIEVTNKIEQSKQEENKKTSTAPSNKSDNVKASTIKPNTTVLSSNSSTKSEESDKNVALKLSRIESKINKVKAAVYKLKNKAALNSIDTQSTRSRELYHINDERRNESKRIKKFDQIDQDISTEEARKLLRIVKRLKARHSSLQDENSDKNNDDIQIKNQDQRNMPSAGIIDSKILPPPVSVNSQPNYNIQPNFNVAPQNIVQPANPVMSTYSQPQINYSPRPLQVPNLFANNTLPSNGVQNVNSQPAYSQQFQYQWGDFGKQQVMPMYNIEPSTPKLQQPSFNIFNTRSASQMGYPLFQQDFGFTPAALKGNSRSMLVDDSSDNESSIHV